MRGRGSDGAPLRNEDPAHFGMWMNSSWWVDSPLTLSHTGGLMACKRPTRRGHGSAQRRSARRLKLAVHNCPAGLHRSPSTNVGGGGGGCCWDDNQCGREDACWRFESGTPPSPSSAPVAPSSVSKRDACNGRLPLVALECICL
jgi:hypothetical protein